MLADGNSREPRSDAARNHQALVQAATAAVHREGPRVPMATIAADAGVGIGTLYRHFPTRDAIVEAVYRREVQQLAASAERLLATRPAGEALHQWMRVFVDYIATKKVLAQALASMVGGTTDLYAASGVSITNAMTLLVTHAAAAGDIRADADPTDLLRALVGFTYGATGPGWQASALRLIDILMDGLRPVQAG